MVAEPPAGQSPAPKSTPETFDAPDRETLRFATGLALVIGTFVAVLFVLPAELGVDPTGFGEIIGIKSIAAPAGAGLSAHGIEDQHFQFYRTEVVVPAGVGLEYKLDVEQGAGFVYSWNATAPMYFDFHGEPRNDTSGYFESYQIDAANRADGSFHAPFAGSHGWYWRNDTSSDVTVVLEVVGHFDVLGVR